ncbi:MAG: hypothetical protein KDD69_18820 [Bdellovibrionales bacterium]|nr:hypothetical protein [Bdellovibrionales bacterium]
MGTDEKLLFLELVEQGISGHNAQRTAEIDGDTFDVSAFAEYRSIVALEDIIAAEAPTLACDLTDSILAALEDEDRVGEPQLVGFTRGVNQLIGTLVVANFALLLVLGSLLGNRRTALDLHARTVDIQPIVVEVAAGPASLPMPGARVDVEVAFQSGDRELETSIARFIEVAAVHAATDDSTAPSRVVLLAPTASIDRINLARLFGQVKLAVVPLPTANAVEKAAFRMLLDPEGRTVAPSVSPFTEAVVYLRDKEDNQVRRQVLVNGQWMERTGPRLLAF